MNLEEESKYIGGFGFLRKTLNYHCLKMEEFTKDLTALK